MSAFVASVAGWSLIPDLATTQLLRAGHTLSSKYLHRSVPTPRTAEYVRDYRSTYAVVVLGYLVYNFINSATSMNPNFYEMLGVSPSADDSELKVAFRGFARKFHPDRVGPQGGDLFIVVRDAYEALKDPVVRFAYDRFGPDVLSWKHCSNVRDYLRHGLMQSSGYHIVAGMVLVAFSAVGKSSPVAYWRYLLFVALFASELFLVLSPSPLALPNTPLTIIHEFAAFPSPSAPNTHRNILNYIFPHRVAYQHVLFLHHVFMFLSVALSRVGPTLFPSEGPGLDVAFVNEIMARFAELARGADREVSRMLHTQLHAIHNLPETPVEAFAPLLSFENKNLCPEIMDLLTDEMELMIIEGTLKREAQAGPLRTTIEAALGRISRKRGLKDGKGNLRDAPKKSGKGNKKKGDGGEGWDDEPPSPISRSSFVGLLDDEMGQGKLPPSPRPSPTPPPELRRRASGVKISSSR